MSFSKYDEHLQIDLCFSPLLACFLLISHSVALTLVPMLTLPLWATMGLGVGVLMSLISTLDTHVLRYGRRRAVVRLIWAKEEDWCLIYADGMVHNAKLMPESFMQPYLIVLNFQITDLPVYLRYHSVIFVADAVDPVILRRLRVRITYQGN